MRNSKTFLILFIVLLFSFHTCKKIKLIEKSKKLITNLTKETSSTVKVIAKQADPVEVVLQVTNQIIEGPFQIVSKATGKCITSSGEGNTLALSYCSYYNEESNWFKIEYQSGVYMYMNQKTYLVMNLDCSSSKNGATITELAKQDKPNQMWKVEVFENNYIRLQSTLEDGKCVTASEKGTDIYQYDCSNGDDQRWLTRVPNFQFSTSKLMIKSKSTGLCMKSPGPRSKLIEATCDLKDNRQAFTFYENSDKSFLIFVNDYQVLDNFGFGTTNGNPIYTWDVTDSGNQKWFIVPIGDSKYVSFLNEQSGKCLDVPIEQSAEGVSIQQYDCINNDAQSFSLIESSVVNIPKGDTYIYLNYPNKCLSFFPNKSATQDDCVFGNGLQAWRFILNSDGTYYIKNVYTGQILNYANYNEINVSPHFTGGDDQRWWVYTLDTKNIKIRNKKTGRCISVKNGSMNSGLSLTISECTDNNIYQNFSFKNFAYVPVPESDKQYFQIINKATNKCVRMKNIFTQLQQYDCNDEDMSLVWRLVRNLDNTYKLISLSGFVMDDYTSGWGNGNPVVGWEPNEGDSQKWLLVPMNQDYLTIVQSSNGKCLDLSGGSTANGALMQLWECLNNSNQNFYLKKVNVKEIPLTFTQLTNIKHEKCVNINTVYQTPFQMTCSDGNAYNQALKMEPNSDASYYIRAYGGLVVDLSNPEDAWKNGLHLLLMPLYKVALSQKWYILPEGKYFRLINFHSRKCFNLSEGDFNNGSLFDQWECKVDETNQLFSFNQSNVTDLISSWVTISHKTTSCLSFRGINDRLLLNDCQENFEGQSWKFIQNPDQSYSITLSNGLIMENSGSGVYDGNEISIAQASGTEAQKWFIVPVADNKFSLVNKGSTKCLDVSGGTTSLGHVMIIWTCDITNENQSFSLVNSTVKQIPINTWVKLVNKSSGKCVKSLKYKSRVINSSCSDDDSASAWKLISHEDGTYWIQSYSGTSMLTISEGNDAYVTTQIPWNDQDKWYLIPNLSGYYGLLNYSNRRCMDLTFGDNRDGNPYQLWDCNMGNNENQAFAIEPMTIKELPVGWVQIINKNTNSCIKFNGETNQLTDGNCCTDKDSTYWKLIKNDNVTYRIESFTGNSFVIDLKSNWWKDATPIQSLTWNGSDSQRFLIAPFTRDLFHLIHVRHNRCIANNASNYELWGCNDSNQFLYYIIPVYDLTNPCNGSRI